MAWSIVFLLITCIVVFNIVWVADGKSKAEMLISVAAVTTITVGSFTANIIIIIRYNTCIRFHIKIILTHTNKHTYAQARTHINI